jgi:hypothetical protein
MRSRTNTDANAEASPARASSVNPNVSPCDKTVVVWVSLAKTVLVADSRVSLAKIVLVAVGIFKLSGSGGDSKGREPGQGSKRCSNFIYGHTSLGRLTRLISPQTQLYNSG